MDDDWGDAIVTACLWGPPSLAGVLALVNGPIRFSGRALTTGMNRLVAAIWLAPLPVTILVAVGIVAARRASADEAGRIAQDASTSVLRLLSVLCLLAGGTIALAGARPVIPPKRPKGKRRRRG